MIQRFRHIDLVLTIAIVLSPSNAFAENRYGSDVLDLIAKSLQIKSTIDTLSDDTYIAWRGYNNHPLTVIVRNRTVEHIGYTIFSKELRYAMHSPTFDFLERYALEADIHVNRTKDFERQMFEDEVHFSVGSIHSLKNIYGDSTLNFSFDNLQDKVCRLKWLRNNDLFCSVSFPVDYNLYHGMDIAESQRRLAEDLLHTVASQSTTEKVTKEELLKLFEPNYYVMQGDSIYVAQLTDNKYFKEVNEGVYQLIFSDKYPVESFANLLTTNSIENDIQAYIKLILYDFKSTVINIPLTQLLTYFNRQGCKAYFGFIGKNDESIEVELLLTKQDEGYCHVIKLLCDINSIKKKTGIFQGRMNCFIPVSKIKSLFGNK